MNASFGRSLVKGTLFGFRSSVIDGGWQNFSITFPMWNFQLNQTARKTRVRSTTESWNWMKMFSWNRDRHSNFKVHACLLIEQWTRQNCTNYRLAVAAARFPFRLVSTLRVVCKFYRFMFDASMTSLSLSLFESSYARVRHCRGARTSAATSTAHFCNHAPSTRRTHTQISFVWLSIAFVFVYGTVSVHLSYWDRDSD